MTSLSEPTVTEPQAPRRRRRGLSIAAVVVALAATGAIIVPAALSDPNRRAANAGAGRLLDLYVPPPGSTRVSKAPVSILSSPAEMEATDHLIDRARFWIARIPPVEVFSWLKSHPPKGLTKSGGGYGSEFQEITFEGHDEAAFIHARLLVEVVPNGTRGSFIRADGMTVWLSRGPTRYPRRGRALHVLAASGCPRSIAGYQDVSNADEGLTERMLPKERPIGGMICAFGSPFPANPHTVRRVSLTRAEAWRLAETIDRMRFVSAGNSRQSCPNDQDLNDVIVFAYSTRADVDLWYHTSGCSYLDNGFVVVNEVANPSFYDSFVPMIARLTSARATS